jgi:hypothetical protein
MNEMDNQLELLISLYKAEKNRLQKSIDKCLLETEFLMAHYHSEALYLVNRKLQTLNNIEDKLYDEKEITKRIINGMQEKFETEGTYYMKDYYEKTILQYTQKLDQLNQIPKQNLLSDKETLLEETLKKLLDYKIKNLKLILKKADNLLLKFSYSNRILKVTLPFVKQLTKNWILYDENINSFKNLGFNLNANETNLILKLSGTKDEVSKKLKFVLSKIIFEIFYFKEFNNESYIQFSEKASSELPRFPK